MALSQFLLLGLGDNARVGGNVRVLALAENEQQATSRLDELDSTVLGHIALVEVKQHYERRPAVQSTPTDAPLFASEKSSEKKP
jgi:hypothetical protein